MKRAIFWFRRDLRLTDNTALFLACEEADEVTPVFIRSTWRGNHSWTGPRRQGFLCGCLESLHKNLETLGSRLIVRQGDAVEELSRLVRETGAEAVFLNRDPDPFGRSVEAALEKRGRAEGFEVRACQDVCLHERDEVLTAAGTPFRVFTAYAKAWARLPKATPGRKPRRLNTPADLKSEPLPTLETWGWKSEGTILPAGERAARDRMEKFLAGPIAAYGDQRNLPAVPGTSRLSQDLRFGLISIRELFHRCQKRLDEVDAKGRSSVLRYVNELIWREFAMNILWHYPEVLEVEFDPKYRGLGWSRNKESFDRWCQGLTGFPIVDAAMRELNETGFMHNRARMITAMFLTKDLRLNWRLGEQYFLQQLVDGEIAINNASWQWCAGTGADAAPYFRIQNPWTQTATYDPEGVYIKKWIPELRDVPAEKLCKPPTGLRLAKDYPLPMVDHARARQETLDFFASYREAAV